MSADLDLVTAGEGLAVLSAEPGRRIRSSASLALDTGGAELNVAVATARLGLATAWQSRVGDDEFGALLLTRARREGIDVSNVSTDPTAPTGLYLREQLGGSVRAHYIRRGSAAARLDADDVDRALLARARTLHVSGVTPALSASSRSFTAALVRAARELGLLVSFDVNYRSKLWTAEEARACCEALLPEVDVLFVGHEEAALLWDRADAALAKELQSAGPGEVLLKLGEGGALAVTDDSVMEVPAFPVPVVDTVGAGDAFAAGYLAARHWGRDLAERLRVATAMGAFAVMTAGDSEGLPDRRELDHFLTQQQGDQR